MELLRRKAARTLVVSFAFVPELLSAAPVFAAEGAAGGSNPLVRLLLFFSGYYGWFWPFLCLFLLVIGVGFLFLNTLKPDAPVFELFPWLSPRKLSGYEREAQTEDEYSRLLSNFGLDESASEEDIKSAYRDRARALHPDSSELPEGMTEEERVKAFDTLKLQYDRILEMRGGSFGGR